MALKTDRYFYSLNMRQNKVSDSGALKMIKLLADNKTLFCIDLRENKEISNKTYCRLALKLLASYTLVGRKLEKEDWQVEQAYFNSELLNVGFAQSSEKQSSNKPGRLKEMS
jgi:hypothetical protein